MSLRKIWQCAQGPGNCAQAGFAKDREERYQTCGAMQAGLEDVMVELSVRPSQRGLASFITALFDEDLPKEEALLREVAAAQVQEDPLVPVQESLPVKAQKQKMPAPVAVSTPVLLRKAVDPELDYCPWCDVSVKTPDSAQAAMVSCASCGKTGQGSTTRSANYCGVKMQAGVPGNSLTGVPVQNYDMSSGAQGLPVMIYYNAGKIITEKTMDFLELAVANAGAVPVEGFKVMVRGTLIARVLEEKLPFTLEPGRPYALNVPGFLPRCAGKDSLHLSVEGRAKNGEPFFLLGTIPVEVSGKEEVASNVSVNISAKGPLIVDLEDAIPGLAGKKSPDRDPSVPQWIPLELHPDLEKQESASRKFPPACVSADACTLDEAVASALHSVSPETVPMASFSCPRRHGVLYCSRFFSVARPQARHKTMCLPFCFPRNLTKGKTSRSAEPIAGFSSEKNRVFIRDTSSNGTFLGKERLPSKEDVMLATGQKVVTRRGFWKCGADIYTNGQSIIAVRLKRQNNKTHERYILAHGPVPLGPGNGNPIQVAGAPNFLGGGLLQSPGR